METPFFSVIIPTYNRANFLAKALSSVLEQDFRDFEVIVVDDGSTDTTKDYINTITDNRLIYIYQPHQGVSFARNAGLAKARGKFICFLDSDDWFKKEKLRITCDYIKKYPDIKIFHTEEIWYRNGSRFNPKLYHKKPDGDVFTNAVRLCSISISTAAIKKELFETIGRFDESLPACEDYDFWLRATAKYPVKLIPKYLTLKEGGHGDQLSKQFVAMDTFRIYALNKILESAKLTPEQNAIAAKELRRKCAIYIKGAAKRGKVKDVEFYTKLMEKYKE
ncbi:MAG: glycosyltransferase [Candidatus Omnitrophota bacterium]